MDTAINATTGGVVTAWALELKDPEYQFPYDEKWYADPNNIESYNQELVQDIRKIEVRFRKASYNVVNYKGTKYDMPPSFFVLNKEKLGINTIPETKEHKIAKNWIYNSCKNKNLNLIFSTAKRPFDYSNKINLGNLKIDFEKVSIEVPVVTGRKKQRADVILPFIEFHDLLGCGIVFEIQFSKQMDEDRVNRTINWALKGYSICWIMPDDVETIGQDFIELKNNDLFIEVFGKTIKDYSENQSKDFRIELQNTFRAVHEKLDDFNKNLNKIKEEIESYSASKVFETSESIKRLRESLEKRESELIENLSNIKNNPLSELFTLYKNKISDVFSEKESSLNARWDEKMKQLNYPFAIGNCKICERGVMYRKTTKTGKECYGCSNYPNCTHTIWIN